MTPHPAITQSITKKAKEALHQHFSRTSSPQGYVDSLQDNLIPGVRLDQFEADLRRGDGNELKAKFRAVHSSAASAVNCFAPFRDRPVDLRILGHQGAVSIEFEKQLRIFPDRTPANLDVWIDLGSAAVAVESKLLEYFLPKVSRFAPAYGHLAPPASEASWWAAYDDASRGGVQHLDRAQLLKHYFGLRNLQQSSAAPKKLTLLYLFWEPLNWESVAECRRHRQETRAFAKQVAGASISFEWRTYSQLWNEWAKIPALTEHANFLKARYEVNI